MVKNKQQMGMMQLKAGYKTGTAAAAASKQHEDKQASKQAS